MSGGRTKPTCEIKSLTYAARLSWCQLLVSTGEHWLASEAELIDPFIVTLDGHSER